MSTTKQPLFNLPTRDLEHIARLAADDLAQLRGKRLFITGGTGFFGKWLLAALDDLNQHSGLDVSVTVLSRDPPAFILKHLEIGRTGFEFFYGHVAEIEVRNIDADFIIHAATDTTAFTRDDGERERSRTIVEGTRRVLELAEANSARLLNISSGAVYGTAASQLTGAKEGDYSSAQAVTPYGEAKREAEDLCAKSEVDFSTARAFAFLGPLLPLDAHFAAGNFLRDSIKGGPIVVRGDGTALRSYLHPADLVVWLLRILVRGQRGRAYNVGSNENVTTSQLANLIADAVSPRPEVTIQSLQPQGPQNIYLPDIYRARTELGLDVAISLGDAIKRTLEFLK